MSEIAEAGDLYIYTVLVDGIYIKADADNKKVVRKEIVINLVKNEDKLCELGFTLCDEMPNVVPYSEKKGWTNYELDGIITKAISGERILLPIWHNITKREVIDFSPSLADKLACNTAINTIDEIATEKANLIQTT